MNIPEALTAAAPAPLAAWLVAHPVDDVVKRAGHRMEVPLRNGDMLGVNDSFYLSKDDKRFVVVGTFPATRTDGKHVPVVVAVALSGGDKGSLIREDFSAGMYGGIAHKLRIDGPIFYGASAQARYKAYLTYLEKLGNAELALPLVTSPEKPVEGREALPTSDVADPALADVVISHTPATGTIANWDYAADKARGDDSSIYRVIRKGGFVWSHHDKVWRRTNSVGTVETRAPIDWMVAELHRRGFTVALDLDVGDVAESIEAKRAYLRERAARMAESAERKAGAAGARLSSAERQAEKELTHQEIEGYYPTPENIVDLLLAHAGALHGLSVIDPSAGHGALVVAARAAGAGNVDAIEVNPSLRDYLKKHGIPVVADDVFDTNFDPGNFYDVVLMNPPFENGLAIDHVKRAYSFLAPDGRLVAVVPASIGFRTDRKHAAFRSWIEEHGGTLSPPVQATFGRATVNVQILDLPGPGGAASPIDESTLQRIAQARAEARSVAQGPTRQQSQVQQWYERAHELARQQENSYRTGSGGLSKAERAELKGLNEAIKAHDLAEKAKRLAQASGRVGAADVSYEGRSALKPPRKVGRRAPRKEDDFWEGVKAAMRKVKGQTGAVVIEKGFGDRGRKSWNLAWNGGRKRRVWVSVHDPHGYAGDTDKIPADKAQWTVYDLRNAAKLASGDVDRDPALVVGAIVAFLKGEAP